MKVKVSKEYRQKLIQGYQNEVFLAEKIKRIFCGINNDNDRVIHNDLYDDLIVIIGDKRDEFLKDVAKLITGYMR